MTKPPRPSPSKSPANVQPAPPQFAPPLHVVLLNPWGGDGWTYTGDFNQDGYSDIASPNGGSLYLKLGSPSGFSSTTWSISNLWGSRYYTRAGDFNADGRTDLASANRDKVHLKLNTGSGFTDLTWPVNNTWGGNDGCSSATSTTTTRPIWLRRTAPM